MPTLGHVAVNRWRGLKPYPENRVFREVPGGLVGNTNNKVLTRPFSITCRFSGVTASEFSVGSS